MPNSPLTRKIVTIHKLLKALYGTPKKRRLDALDELIMTILSQNTTDKNSIPAYYALKKGFEDWEAVRSAPVRRIVPFIKRGGLANIKAQRIKGALNEIRNRQGCLDLSFLKKYPVSQAYDYLRSLKGVGPKTASIVLLFSFHKPLMPVDTHIYRVAGRIGLLGAHVNVEKAHEILTENTPPAIIHDLHINMIEHGRRVCKAQRPLCQTCGISGVCVYFISKTTKKLYIAA